jgi:hypothetical protein
VDHGERTGKNIDHAKNLVLNFPEAIRVVREDKSG